MTAATAWHWASDGPQAAGKASWHAILPVIMAETRTLRAALHRAAAPARCDLHLHVAEEAAEPIRISGDCVCRDLLVDMLVEAHRHLESRSTPITNPPGAIRTHLKTRATGDWIRNRRLAMGAQARCDRIRGGARARGLPDEWHRALLEYLVDEAGSPAPLDDHECLVRRLAIRCAGEFGGEQSDYFDRVRAGIRLVEQHCRRGPRVNAGTPQRPEFVTWWEKFIERPLGRRPRRSVVGLSDSLSELPAGQSADAPRASAPAVPDPGPADLTDQLVVERLVAAIRRRPESPIVAVRAGLADLAASGLVGRPVIAAMLDDEHRMQSALRELAMLA